MSKFCTNCGVENEDAANICVSCGNAFEMPVQQPDYSQYYQQPVQQPDYSQYYQQPVQQPDYSQYYQQPTQGYYPPAQPLNNNSNNKLGLASILNIPAAFFQLLTILYWLLPVMEVVRYSSSSYYSYSNTYYYDFNIFQFADWAGVEYMIIPTLIVILLNIAALALSIFSILKPKIGNMFMQLPQIGVVLLTYVVYVIIAVVAENEAYRMYCINDGGFILLAVISVFALGLHGATLALRLKDKKAEKQLSMQMQMNNTPYYY